jgi:hypothetical protein
MQLWKFEKKNKKYRWIFKEKKVNKVILDNLHWTHNENCQTTHHFQCGLWSHIARSNEGVGNQEFHWLEYAFLEFRAKVLVVRTMDHCTWFPSVFSACVFRTGEQALPTPNPWMLVFGKWSQMEKSKHLSSPATGLYGMN